MELIRCTYEMSGVDYSKLELDDLPSFLMKREYMKLKDVVKDNLLHFLPAKSLVRFMSVSKEWHQWISCPLLAFQQSNHFKKLSGFFTQAESKDHTFLSLNAAAYGVASPDLRFLPERVNILSSSSGLLACHGCMNDDAYYICNPTNKEWARIPEPLLYHGLGASTILAFEPSARNIEQRYQLISAVPSPDGEVFFELYSSSSRSWTILKTTLVGMEDLSIKGNGLFMKGVAYWLTNYRMVIAYDVERELHEVIPISSEQSSDGILTQIGGELCYITMSHLSGNKYHIIIHGGMDLSVKRRLEISIGASTDGASRFRVLPCFDGETVMILFENCIYSYSISDGIIEEKTRVGIYSASADNFLPYVNSLVHVQVV